MRPILRAAANLLHYMHTSHRHLPSATPPAPPLALRLWALHRNHTDAHVWRVSLAPHPVTYVLATLGRRRYRVLGDSDVP